MLQQPIIRRLFLMALLLPLLSSCTRTANPDIEMGSSYQYQSGHPEVRLSALGTLDEQDQGVINVAADIVDGSLVFHEEDGVQRASIEIEVRIQGVEGTNHTDNYTTTKTVDSDQPGYVLRRNLISFQRNIEAPPGDYEVYVSVTDQSSGNRTTRQTTTFIPDPQDEIVRLTSVRLLAKDLDEPDREYQPVTTYDVSTRNDSIRFVVQVTNNRPESPIEVNSRLIQFDSDTTAARPMSFNNYSSSSIQYKGIDYRRTETVDQTTRNLEQPGSVLIEYRFPTPSRGNFRFEVRIDDSEDDELFKARDFGVFGRNFPSIESPRELAEPLIYLMDHREHEKMMEIEDPDSLKAAVDRFWLSNVGSANQARQVISMYYERVEQANKQFTNFKEGWKTDPGMVYILFGPPWYVETRLNRMRWSYSYDRSDPRYNYVFERPRGRSEFYPFNNYLLQRDQGYFNVQYQQVQRWLSGQILYRSI